MRPLRRPPALFFARLAFGLTSVVMLGVDVPGSELFAAHEFRPDARAARMPIEDVARAHSVQWLAEEGVIEVRPADWTGDVILVLIDCPRPELLSRLPREVDGYRVVIRVADRIRAVRGRSARSRSIPR